jgi:CelD/BcsL family acetyltransferase involved in cellulose biosynthesis
LKVEIQVVENIDGFRRMESEWNAALERSRNPSPFMTFEWLLSYLEVFGESISLFLVIAREGSRIVAAAPLMINADRQLVFIGYPHNDYADFMILDEESTALGEICDFLHSQRNHWKKVILDQMQEEFSHWKEIGTHLTKRNRPHRVLLSDNCPAMVINDVNAARSKYYKRNITTYVNWYRSQGAFAFDICRSKEEALARLEDLFAQHIERRDQTPFASQFNDEVVRDFYRRFVDRMFPRDWVLLPTLTLNDEFLALYLAFPYRNTLYLYTTSFNGAYSKRSPGQVILRFLFDYAVEHNIGQLDFARGGESYKDRFANVLRQNRRVVIYKSSLAKGAADIFYAIRYSRLADRLYRNRRITQAKYAFLYHRRKEGLLAGFSRAMASLLAPASRREDDGGKN